MTDTKQYEEAMATWTVTLDHQNSIAIVTDPEGTVLNQAYLRPEAAIFTAQELEKLRGDIKAQTLYLQYTQTTEELARWATDALAQITPQLEALMNQFPEEGDGRTFRMIADKLLVHLTLMSRNITYSYDLLCFHSRNVYEIYLWLAGIAEEQKHLDRFYANAVRDFYELQRAYGNHFTPSVQLTPAQEADLKKRAEKDAAKYNYSLPSQSQNLKELARDADKYRDARIAANSAYADSIGSSRKGIERDYDFFYKLLNKFVHPSPMFLASYIERHFGRLFLHTAVEKTLRYGEMSRDALQRALDNYFPRH